MSKKRATSLACFIERIEFRGYLGNELGDHLESGTKSVQGNE